MQSLDGGALWACAGLTSVILASLRWHVWIKHCGKVLVLRVRVKDLWVVGADHDERRNERRHGFWGTHGRVVEPYPPPCANPEDPKPRGLDCSKRLTKAVRPFNPDSNRGSAIDAWGARGAVFRPPHGR